MNKILIVDDERTTRLSLSEAFKQRGYMVGTADNGENALIALSDGYDVVLLDMEMPGIKGDEVLKVAAELTPDTDFIVLTAYASTETAITALRTGAADYLHKPSSLTTIFNAVERALAQQREQKLAEHELNELRMQVSETAVSHLSFGNIEIDKQSQLTSINGRLLNLTPIEHKLLYQLIQHAGDLQTYTQLAQESHELSLTESEARTLLRTHVYRLSKKINDRDTSCTIQSIRGRGIILTETTKKKPPNQGGS
jgi:DNA-binding response OmpR family regulator